jgi:hypothetical protein
MPPDGITWTARTAAEANGWTSVTYGNGLFVAVSYRMNFEQRITNGKRRTLLQSISEIAEFLIFLYK